MLKRVSIQNFKSLKDVTLDLQKVNLLIGPNNSGKTNFLKALEFMAAWNAGKISADFDSKNLVFNHSEYGQGFRIEFIVNEINSETSYKYFLKTHVSQITDNADGFAEYLSEINDNGNEINPSNLDYHPFFGGTLNGKKISDAEYNPGKFLKVHVASYTPGSYSIIRILDDLKLYKPDPNKLIQPGPVGIGEDTANADVSNLVSFLDLMLGKYRKTVFSKIESDLYTCIPEFDEINLDDVLLTEELKKQFGDKSFKRIGLTNSKQNITYWADELSEGTLYFLALLCIINQPNPPKLLLLEEPERGIHPRRIREVMDFIFRLAEEKDIQIILTSHNENVLNEFTSMPEAVFVFSKDDEGATHVKNLQKDIIEPSHQRSRETGTKEIDFTSNLGESWMYGLLGGVPEEAL